VDHAWAEGDFLLENSIERCDFPFLPSIFFYVTIFESDSHETDVYHNEENSEQKRRWPATGSSARSGARHDGARLSAFDDGTRFQRGDCLFNGDVGVGRRLQHTSISSLVASVVCKEIFHH